MTRTTLVIPTLNRPGDLARCLRSVSALRRGFDEIIIVEQGDLRRTQDIARHHGALNIKVCHQTIRSLTRARNLGVEKSKGDLIFFVDDDTTLDRRYVETAVDYFDRHPDVVGLTGHIEETRRGPYCWRAFTRSIALLLLTASFRWEILRSGANSFPVRPMGPSWFRKVQFLAGCHFVCRRAVFEAGFRFDERLILWGFGEDVMFSYRVWKHYGRGSLAYFPAFRLRHHMSPEQSLTDESAIRMQVIYRFLFWHGEVYGRSWLNALCYVYSQIGFSLSLFMLYRHTPLRTLRAITRSYRYLLANHREIAREHVDYNRFITEG